MDFVLNISLFFSETFHHVRGLSGLNNAFFNKASFQNIFTHSSPVGDTLILTFIHGTTCEPAVVNALIANGYLTPRLVWDVVATEV
jgi:hypothetical protein